MISKWAKIFPFKNKQKNKNSKKLQTKSVSILSGVSDVVDIISPDGLYFPDWEELLDKKQGYIQTGGKRFTRIFQVKQFPSQIYMGFLNDFYSMGDCDISIHSHPGDPDMDVDELTKLLVKLETTYHTKSGKHSSNDAVVEASFADTKVLRDNISLNRDRLFYISVFISISAESLEELNKKTEDIERIAGQKMMRIAECFLEEDAALTASAPMAVNPIEDNHSNFDLGAATSLFPFDSPELTHPNGTYMGLNYHTGTPIFFNNFIGGKELPVSHTGRFGQTRSGKSTANKVEIARDATRQIRTWVYDPEGEFGETMRTIGGKEVIFRPGEFCGINFFDIEPDELENRNHLISKIEEVKSVLIDMMERRDDNEHTEFPISPEEDALLELAVRNEYARIGITDDPDSLYEADSRPGMVGYKKKPSPDISSLHAQLEKIERENIGDTVRMRTRLIPWLRTGTMGMFDGQTTVDLYDTGVSFNLSALDSLKRVKPIGMKILQFITWEYFIKRELHIKKRLLQEEAWLFTKLKGCLEFQEELARRAAKRNCTFTVSSQNFREFTKTEQGKVVLAQLGVLYIFRQSRSDLRAMQELWDLPEGQIDFVRKLTQGECLMKFADKATGLIVDVLPIEEPFAYTDAGQWGTKDSEVGEVDNHEEEAS